MTGLIRVNYLYFGVLFILFSLVHCTHAHVIEEGSLALKALFIFYALGQSLLEVGLLVLIGSWLGIKRKQYQYLFIAGTLLLLLLHLVDFPLVRIMDLSIWQACGLACKETWENFIEVLYATHISLWTWAKFAVGCVLFLFVGLLSYYWTEKRAIYLSVRTCVYTFAILPLTMLLCDCMIRPAFPEAVWRAHEKALPWKHTLVAGRGSKLKWKAHLKPVLSEELALQSISRLASPFSVRFISENNEGKKGIPECKEQPDIFLFIIESLRSDYLTNEIAPHLVNLEKISSSAVQNIASANATQLSWFSIFYGKFPFYFATFKEKKWQSGSPALCLLKQMGYQIEVFSAARLSYYKMDQLIFGKDLQLADVIHSFPRDDSTPAYESDRRTMDCLMKRTMEKDVRKARCYIVFLDSTHFGYSWPTEKSVFRPYNEQIDYLELLVSKRTLASVKNRYRNAIHYLDGLFGEFASSLKSAKKWEESIIVLTGDHGEEFYEGGHLFHASSLSSAQTRVPLLFKLGRRPKESAAALGSHIDLFPTLFHHLFEQEMLSDEFFDGQSILTPKKCPYTLTGRYNGCCNPYEFCIETPRQKLIAQFTQPYALFEPQEIRIMEVRDCHDRPMDSSLEALESEFCSGFDQLFKRA